MSNPQTLWIFQVAMIGYWDLVIGYCLEFGIWLLEFIVTNSALRTLNSELPLPLPLSSNEFLHHRSGLFVGKLDKRMFHRIGRDGEEGTSDPSFPSNLTTSDGIDGHPAAIGRVLHREPHFKVQRNLSEPPSLHAEETDLIVLLPGDIIRGTDMNILRFQRGLQEGLNRFGLRNPFIP
mgnify:CR=1 FL=1